MVCRLPEKYRDAVILFYFCGLDIAQAAGCLRMPEGTFKSRLHRARKLLASRFAGAGLAPRAEEAT
jgi:RNA polymerase sigma-70 factor (ECF subfamily)